MQPIQVHGAGRREFLLHVVFLLTEQRLYLQRLLAGSPGDNSFLVFGTHNRAESGPAGSRPFIRHTRPPSEIISLRRADTVDTRILTVFFF